MPPVITPALSPLCPAPSGPWPAAFPVPQLCPPGPGFPGLHPARVLVAGRQSWIMEGWGDGGMRWRASYPCPPPGGGAAGIHALSNLHVAGARQAPAPLVPSPHSNLLPAGSTRNPRSLQWGNWMPKERAGVPLPRWDTAQTKSSLPGPAAFAKSQLRPPASRLAPGGFNWSESPGDIPQGNRGTARPHGSRPSLPPSFRCYGRQGSCKAFPTHPCRDPLAGGGLHPLPWGRRGSPAHCSSQGHVPSSRDQTPATLQPQRAPGPASRHLRPAAAGAN